MMCHSTCVKKLKHICIQTSSICSEKNTSKALRVVKNALEGFSFERELFCKLKFLV